MIALTLNTKTIILLNHQRHNSNIKNITAFQMYRIDTVHDFDFQHLKILAFKKILVNFQLLILYTLTKKLNVLSLDIIIPDFQISRVYCIKTNFNLQFYLFIFIYISDSLAIKMYLFTFNL